jgi:hypothetical protein
VAFPKGNKAASGGKREGAGRPTKEELAERESLRAAIERKREERAAALADRYLEMAEEDPATMRHLVDKVMPDLDETPSAPRAITFIQFNNPSQLPDKEIPVIIEQPVPQENRLPERRGLKFYDFAKRRQ